MKFENGCWIFAEGYTCFPATQIFYVRKDGNALLLTVPTTRINGVGDTLGGVNLTVRISSPAEGIIRLQTWHHTGAIKKTPEFELMLTEEIPMDIIEGAYVPDDPSFSGILRADASDTGRMRKVPSDDDRLTVQSGDIRLEINKKNFTMRFLKKQTAPDGSEKWVCFTSSKGRDLACIKKDFRGLAYDREGDTANTYMRQNLSITVDEHIYGMGERFSAFVKNGQTVRIEH